MIPDPQGIAASQPTISGRIRALHAAGYSRSQIATLVGRSYQQVRQVLKNDERRAGAHALPPGATPTGPHGMTEDARAFQPPNAQATALYRLDVNATGVLDLPEGLRMALKVTQGGHLLAQVNADGSVRLVNGSEGLRQARQLVQSLVPSGRSLADELVAERHVEALQDS